MFCHLCATKIEEGDFFCRNCGEISPVLVSTLDKRNWLATAGIFALSNLVFRSAIRDLSNTYHVRPGVA
jgi:hypothetical protein